MKCNNCGAEISDEARFCEKCGAPVSSDAAPDPAAEVADLPEIGFVPIDPVIVSLPSSGQSRQLRFTAQIEVAQPHQAEVAALIHEAMVQQYADMYVPLESEIAIGLNLGDLKVIGTEPDEQRTKEVIKELFAD